MVVSVLHIREIINVFLSVMTLTIAVVYGQFILHELRNKRYNNLDPATYGAIGWFLISVGEVLRASLVWEIIHYEQFEANYASMAVPLCISLVCIIIGASCAIRVFTPRSVGNTVWIGAVIVATILSIISIIYS